MDLHYSIKDLNQFQIQVKRSIEFLKTNGTFISDQHYLIIIQKLIEENKNLREEVLRKYSLKNHAK